MEKLSTLLGEKKMMLCTAESCTGGMIAAHITQRAGSSSIFDRGFITYSNAAKEEMLGVSSQTLTNFGAVSPQTASEMARGALERSHADIAISITGIAGPGGATTDKPIGLVYMAIAAKGQETQGHECHFTGTRTQIQAQATRYAIEQLIHSITKEARP